MHAFIRIYIYVIHTQTFTHAHIRINTYIHTCIHTTKIVHDTALPRLLLRRTLRYLPARLWPWRERCCWPFNLTRCCPSQSSARRILSKMARPAWLGWKMYCGMAFNRYECGFLLSQKEFSMYFPFESKIAINSYAYWLFIISLLLVTSALMPCGSIVFGTMIKFPNYSAYPISSGPSVGQIFGRRPSSSLNGRVTRVQTSVAMSWICFWICMKHLSWRVVTAVAVAAVIVTQTWYGL